MKTTTRSLRHPATLVGFVFLLAAPSTVRAQGVVFPTNSSISNRAAASTTVTITSTVLHEHKGWGLMPAAFDRQMPTYANGDPGYGDVSWLGTGTTVTPVMDAVCDVGFDIARVYISPTIGKADNTIDQTRLQDLKDHLTILKNKGIPRYIVTIWSPPAYMKLPDHVRYGKYNNRGQYLDPTYADGQGYDFADFYVQVLKDLKDAGFTAPVAVSVQNEPDVDPAYDGCRYDSTDSQLQVYRSVVKQLRQKLDANGFAQTIIQAPEPSSFCNITNFLGIASYSGFQYMNSDQSLKDAIGAFCFHTYATAGTIKDLAAAMAFYNKDIWMTEYSTDFGIRPELRPNSGSDQINWMLNDLRRMAGDIVDLSCHYWFWWRGWHSASQIYDQDLVAADGEKKAKLFFAFQRLWKTVKPGWKVMRMSSTDAELRTDNSGLINIGSGEQWSAPVDLLAFEDAGGAKSCVMLVNNFGTAKAIGSLVGVKGSAADVFIVDGTNDGTKVASRSVTSGVVQGGDLTLPPYSVTLVITSSPTRVACSPFAIRSVDALPAHARSYVCDMQGRLTQKSTVVHLKGAALFVPLKH